MTIDISGKGSEAQAVISERKDGTVRVGLIQTRVSDDITLNVERTIAKIREAAGKNAQIICLQELYRTRYFPVEKGREVADLAEEIPGESTLRLSRLAEELGVVIIAPLFEKDGRGKFYNSAAVIDADGKLLGSYRKVHLPYDPCFYEAEYFAPGDLGYPVFRSRYLSFSVLICYDQWFPEAARICALNGADLIFYPTAIGYLEGDELSYSEWHDAWELIQRSHAIANGVHVAAVNRVGREGEIGFWGSSFVCDSFGKILKRASSEDEEVLVTEIDPSKNKRIQEGWGFIKNRRPDTYSQLAAIANATPRELGYAMPAEWERHEATWLAWPYDPSTFPGRVGRVENLYEQIIGAVQGCEDVNLIVKDARMKARVIGLLTEKGVDCGRINLHEWDYADVWFRDYGPIFLTNKRERRMAMVHWTFDAWGRKYYELMKDAQIPAYINESRRLTYFRPGIVLEGGSIEVNGEGTLLTTEQCLLARNLHLSKGDVERWLRDYFGVEHIIWLRGGIAGDDTDGHVDNIARFVNPSTVLCAYEDDEKDGNHSVLKENYNILLESADQDGNELKIRKLPLPRVMQDDGERLPASYLNFYIFNEKVLVPVFGHRNDRIAVEVIQNAFPDRRIVAVDCNDLLYGYGAIHCITQQEPALD